ncbi:triphosphoribosyl-dephospho-CoA synthase CitG [uncultured Ilyobacter sp.]|jgi:triphosphoribosyl-dephospho-CoA synthase|uniref:triphosphoribosyl-dephospho-CoA synthase CitG n=1 Tax=uncultured Ilyobacter sp. TaxID=544433 RepID=UPI0029C0CF9D|nr:triphosphoribosyl-dephospho-CoA synthase CitG [uncultured Ilyobacter sp.]
MYPEKIYRLGEFALESMLMEVACFPSFGLVSPVSKGAHEDMDYFTFIKSTASLQKYMLKIANRAFSPDGLEIIFKDCRQLGIEAEKEMFKKTKGINTHKGMIFVLGIVLIATAKTLYENKEFLSIQENIRFMTKGLVGSELKTLEKKTNLTHGERVFLEYGITGIRGEVESGIPVIFEYALPAYDDIEFSNAGDNERLLHTLITIMAHCEDTTILHRHDIHTLKEVQDICKKLLKKGSLLNKELLVEIDELDKKFSKKRISPGGCADLLAVTVFLSLIKKEFYNSL